MSLEICCECVWWMPWHEYDGWDELDCGERFGNCRYDDEISEGDSRAATCKHFREWRLRKPYSLPSACSSVYDTLIRLDPDNVVIRASWQDIALRLGCSSSRVGRALKCLQEADIIKLVENGGSGKKSMWSIGRG